MPNYNTPEIQPIYDTIFELDDAQLDLLATMHADREELTADDLGEWAAQMGYDTDTVDRNDIINPKLGY